MRKGTCCGLLCRLTGDRLLSLSVVGEEVILDGWWMGTWRRDAHVVWFFVRIGGLGDVTGSLPVELAYVGQELSGRVREGGRGDLDILGRADLNQRVCSAVGSRGAGTDLHSRHDVYKRCHAAISL